MPDWGRIGLGIATLGGSELFEGAKDVADYARPDTSVLDEAARRAGTFGARGGAEYRGLREGLEGARARLEDQASGRLSLSSEQLRQGLQQNLAAQQSFAASARPANQAAAARTAAIQMGRLGAGFAGQQAQAGIQERQAAQQAILNAYLQQRQQALQAALGGFGLQTQAGGSIAGTPTGGQILLGGGRDLLALGAAG